VLQAKYLANGPQSILKAVQWLFLVAYTCSGLAGLVYEVTWTRLLTLYIGHTTASASAVVAAFLGGLAVGAAAGGRVASRLSPARSAYAYVALEVAVVALALLLPLELSMLTPALRAAYGDSGAGVAFPFVRVASCLVMVLLPALALGATFPLAIRWFARGSEMPARQTSLLYFLNTIGAAAGALLAGFVLIPAIGISRTTYAAMAASTIAALSVLAVARRDSSAAAPSVVTRAPAARPWLAMMVLGLSGFAALVHEIAWTRILSLVIGPTTYAFAAALAAVISGVAIGSGIGAWILARSSRPARWLAFALAAAALTAAWTYSLAGTAIPMIVAREVADVASFDRLLQRGALLTAMLIVPTAACLGAAFPFALALADDRRREAAGQFGLVYAVNTVGSVSGSLAAGFLFIPAFGLQPTLWIVSGCLVAAGTAVLAFGRVSRGEQLAGSAAFVAAIAVVVLSPPWDRALLASGVYMYAPYVPKDLDLETQLKAGEVLYYEEGASATVSVKKLTGTTTLAVDGKTDASNRGDMLTQKLIAHLPLLLHDDPQDVLIVGLGSGVTVGAALTHPIARADVIEISPEVVKASAFFRAENRGALDDRRTNLIVGDGRSHLLLSERKYDVIVSEPSNPWIAGVASLFTREFFAGARDRLKPGGLICQWANAYNISDADLRSIVATFRSVFPNGTVWLVGGDDVLLLAGADPIDDRLATLARHWDRTGVREDLSSVGVVDAFSIYSMFIGGPAELAPYSDGAPVFTDDTSRLEFSAPRELHNRRAGENGEVLSRLLLGGGPAAIREARGRAGAVEWRHRAAMLSRADVHQLAYGDYLKALTLDPADREALDGLVRAALITKQGVDAVSSMKSIAAPPTATWLAAVSKLLAAAGSRDDAMAAAREAVALDPKDPAGYEQLASLFADAGDTIRLDEAVAALRALGGTHAATEYYAGVAAFLHGDANGAVNLAQRALAIDPGYAPTYDLLGAALTKLGQLDEARAAFNRSLTLDAHDSTAYENLGVIELQSGNREKAANYFAEALWLVPESSLARRGLAQSR
jgi:spermidine synthase